MIRSTWNALPWNAATWDGSSAVDASANPSAIGAIGRVVQVSTYGERAGVAQVSRQLAPVVGAPPPKAPAPPLPMPSKRVSVRARPSRGAGISGVFDAVATGSISARAQIQKVASIASAHYYSPGRDAAALISSPYREVSIKWKAVASGSRAISPSVGAGVATSPIVLRAVSTPRSIRASSGVSIFSAVSLLAVAGAHRGRATGECFYPLTLATVTPLGGRAAAAASARASSTVLRHVDSSPAVSFVPRIVAKGETQLKTDDVLVGALLEVMLN